MNSIRPRIEKLSDNVHRFRFNVDSTDTVSTLVISDVHYDSLKCDRKLLKAHLDEIKKKNGIIFIIGDWFDVMATYGDKRTKREEVDPRYIVKGRSYLDVVIEDSIEFLAPYAHHIGLIGYGNHETTIHKFHDTDPLRRLVMGLNAKCDSSIQLGQYSGFIFMNFKYRKGSVSSEKVLHYHHGYGGNAKRSKGMLHVQLQAAKYPQADIMVRGHNHMKWYDPSHMRWRINQAGKIYKDNIHYIQTGSYKDGLGDGSQGWEVQQDFDPTRMGGWFIEYRFNKRRGVTIRPYEAA